MSPRRPDPDVVPRLVQATARILAEEGQPAVSARRVAAEVGTSTMAVYTHFGSMDDLLRAVRREGFRRFGEELQRSKLTDDPVADFMAQGWGYRHFAYSERHLYVVMFLARFPEDVEESQEDAEARLGTFIHLLDRIQRCADAGRIDVPDLQQAGEVVWSSVHGHCLIEIDGYHEHLVRDPRVSYGECLLRNVLAYGDDPERARASLAESKRRAKRSGQLD